VHAGIIAAMTAPAMASVAMVRTADVLKVRAQASRHSREGR
jgi:hypothetical protein